MNRCLFLLLLTLLCTCVRAQKAFGPRTGDFAPEARWISPADSADAPDRWYAWRKHFTLETLPENTDLQLAVDSKYWLWVNDSLVIFEGGLRRGPTPAATYFDVVDVGPYLHIGDNEITLLSWYWGKEGYNHKDSGSAGILADLSAGKIVSDSSWRVLMHPAFGSTRPPYPNYRLPEQNIRFDGRKSLGIWQPENTSAESLPWQQPRVHEGPGSLPWGGLWPRPFPQWHDSGLLAYDSLVVVTDDTQTIVRAYLPRNLTITPALRLANVPAKLSGKTVDLRTDNYLGGSEFNVRSEYILKAENQHFETPGYQNGHYVIYTLPWGKNERSATTAFHYRETRFPTNYVGSFHCDDEDLSTLWGKARNTLNLNLRDAIQDPDRERSQWWGDAVIIIGELMYATDSTSHPLIRKAISNLVEWQKANGVLFSPAPAGNWSQELPCQMLASVGVGFWDYYQYTADTATLRYVYPHVKKYLELWETDSSGLVVERSGGWTWVDWGQHYDKSALFNLWYGHALETAAKMAEVLQLDDDRTAWRTASTNHQAAFADNYAIDSAIRSANHEGPTDDRANGLAYLFGYQQNWPAVRSVLTEQEHASPYMEKYVLEAAFLARDPEFALARMKKRYRAMIDHPTVTTLWEGWGIGPEGYGGGSYNHGWAGGPLTLLSQYVAGIAPLTHGYESFRIAPQPGGLKEITARVPSVKGLFDFYYRKHGDSLQIYDITTPTGLPGSMELEIPANARVELNGVEIFGPSAVGREQRVEGCLVQDMVDGRLNLVFDGSQDRNLKIRIIR